MQYSQQPVPRPARARQGPPAARAKAAPPNRRTPEGETQLSLQQIAVFPPDQQKFLMGERLYPLILKKQPQRAGKITGMLLDSGWGIEELYSLLESEDKLNQKIEEAVAVLDKAK
jgi:hypothetical protein